MASDLFPLLYNGTDKVIITKWRVTVDYVINQNPAVLFFYRQSDKEGNQEGAELKYKVNQSGITVRRLYKNVGDLVQPNDVLLEYEPCSHSTLMKDLCAICGVNINSFDTSEMRKIAENTNVSMVHSIPELRVSKQVAEDLGRADEDRLLRTRKLVLLVDLDQTIIHSTNQDVPKDAADIHHYQLYGQNSPWYHTKLRPHMNEFLEEISKYFELHICTFGARRYAHQISNLIDPKCRYFPKDRILSRDEFFDPRSKTGNMKSLFPCGDSMVCIIDDRVDVWNYAPNVVHVKPYLCFKTDDINAPEKVNLKFKAEDFEEEKSKIDSKSIPNDCENEAKSEIETKDNDQTESSEEISKADCASKSEAAEASLPQNEPKSDTSNSVSDDSTNDSFLVDDTDDYLLYLKDILIRIHKEYYREYDEKMRYRSEGEEILFPDLKKIIPQSRRLVLHGVNIVFSGVIATNMPAECNKYYRLAQSLGAMITNDVIVDGSPKTTHLIGSKWGTVKVNKCIKHPHIKMVTPDWLIICAERWEKVDEQLFRLDKNTVYNKVDREDYRRVFIPYYQPSERNKIISLDPCSSNDGEGASKEEVDDSKTMLDLSPLSSFSVTDLTEMGQEVDDACDDDFDAVNFDDDEDEDKAGQIKSESDEEDDSMSYENEGDYPQGWQERARVCGMKRSREEEEEEEGDNDESGSENSLSSPSSSNENSLSSLDEEAAALERQFQQND